METTRFDAVARAKEGSGKNDGAADREGIGGVRLGGIDVYAFMAGERSGVEPCAVRE